MNHRLSAFARVLTGACILLAASGAHAFIQSTEYFDTNWPGMPGPASNGWTVVSNAFNPVSGWSVNQVLINGPPSQHSPPYACRLAITATNAWIQSPFLTNGVGFVTYYARGSSVAPETNVVEISTNGVNWTTNGPPMVTTATTFLALTNYVNTFSNFYVRIRSLPGTAGTTLSIDDIQVSTPPAQVTYNAVQPVPVSPMNGDSVQIAANVSVQGSFNTMTFTAYWRDMFSSTWNAVNMVTNAPGSYTTATPIPTRPAGSTVQYYLVAAYDSDAGPVTTNYPPAGPAGPTSYTVRERSSYTNMTVIGSVNTNLFLFGPYQWQAAVNATTWTNSTFNFRNRSNAVTTTWGDADPTVTNLPVYGTAEPNAPAIALTGTVTGALSFSFNEQDLTYSIQRCAYQSFDSWTNAAFGVSTNNGWVLSDGLVTNDPTRSFRGSAAILNGKPNASTNSFLVSPYLTNGIGRISFWYRSYETNGSPMGTIVIQKALSPAATNWISLASTNTASTNYLSFALGQADRINHAVRILNNPDGNSARLCLDDVVICDPGAGVTYSNLVNTPASPTILDPVNIAVNIDPQGGATNLQVWTLFRFGTSGIYDALPMTNDYADHFVTVTPIPQGDIGTVQYYVQCAYAGFQSADSSPACLPPDTNAPPSYTSVVPQDYRTENFDTNWPGVAGGGWASPSNAVNPVSGWSVNAVTINNPPYQHSLPYAARLAVTALTSWVRSPLLSNGVGNVTYYDRASLASQPTQPPLTNVVEISNNGLDWTTNGPPNLTPLDGLWHAVTNVVNNYNNLYVRIRVLPGTANQTLSIDDIAVSYPAARVAISNVFLSPGYPSSADSVNASCLIDSQNSLFPAVNMDPTLYYRAVGIGTTNFIPVKMARYTSDQFVTSAGSIPPFPRDTLVQYYVRCDFNGYYGSAPENRSPTFYPAGTVAGPASYNSYVVRAFASPYGQGGVLVNGQYVNGVLLSNGLWQTVVTLSAPTNSLSLAFQASGYSVGNGSATSTVTWGDSTLWQSALPLADIAATGQAAVVINGSFSGSYVIRFNEATQQYIVERCQYQGFDVEGDKTDSIGPYVQKNVSSVHGSVSQNFEGMALDALHTRTENFALDSFGHTPWTNLTTYAKGQMLGFYSFDTFGCIYTNSVLGVPALLTQPTTANINDAFVAQYTHVDPQPHLTGIGTISCKYMAASTNSPATMSFYLFPTQRVDDAMSPWGSLGFWQSIPNASFTYAYTNAWWTNSVTIQTNATWDVIFGATQSMYIAQMSVSDWYATNHITSDGWIANQSWIEMGTDNGIQSQVCRFEASRATDAQYLQSPVVTGGVDTLVFDYCGATTNPVSFQVLISYTNPPVWTPLTAVSGAVFQGTGRDYANFIYTLASSAPLISFCISNQTPVPGALLLDNINITGYTTSNDWYMNNAADHFMVYTNYPLEAREFYYGACYLNTNRLANTEIGTGLLAPNTNVPPCVRTPVLNDGVGEVSFWYRNWALSGTPTPGRLLVQTSTTGGNGSNEWTTIAGGIVTNIVNTNDYVFYQGSVYDPNARYVRVCNDDLYASAVGRVCLDNFLVTAPMASSLSMSNLVISPPIPLFTDRVDVAVDVYNMFLNPTNINLQAVYATATNYAGLAAAPETVVPMTCIATNPVVPGGWYRFRTSGSNIPPYSTDTYVKYTARATFGGYHTEVTSPNTNRQFGVTPTWYYPMAYYTTNSAYYVVYDCPTGSVWINEVNPRGFVGNTNQEFVEICGAAGIDLSGWGLDDLDSGAQTTAVYRIPNGTSLSDQYNGFGFWVIGGSSVTNRDMALTVKLGYAGGVRLRRSMGAYEHAVCYQDNTPPPALTNLGFTYIGSDANSSAKGISATGTGSTANAFTTWVTASTLTPGIVNAGQVLVLYVPTSQPPLFMIYAIRVDTNVWLECTQTNGWSAAPYYTTNLTDSNSWSSVPAFSQGMNASNCVLNFPPPTNTTPQFFKVKPVSNP